MVIGVEDVLVLIFLLLPLIAALYIVIAKSDSEADRIKRIQDWIRIKHETLSPDRSYNKYGFRPFLWLLKPIAGQTNKIPNPHWSAGVWVFCTGYATYLLLFAALMVGWLLLVGVLILAGLWLLVELLGSSAGDEEDEYEPRGRRSTGMPFSGGKSVEREGFFGKYTEHEDEHGNVIGESREQEGFFGSYTEHKDAEGNVVGESREQEGFFGNYTEHSNTDGGVVGESREQEGFLGDYTEHKDVDGNVIGESRKREGFLDDYIEHDEK